MLSVFQRMPFDRADTMIVWSVAALLLIGLVMVTSASLNVAAADYGSAFYFAKRQAVFLLLGLTVAALVYWLVPISLLRSLRGLAILTAFAALLVVFLPGVGMTVNGSRRWLNLGAFSVQASEIAKLCLVVYLAGYIDTRKDIIQTSAKAFVGPAVLLVMLAGLLLMEPDLGAVVVIGICALGMLFMAGVKLRYFVGLVCLALVAVALLIWVEPYRWARFISFLDPWEDRFGSGYQLTQSLIAFGRGHWAGTGLGQGVQKLFYLPEAHTDFVFAVLAEELGLIGVSLMVFMFAGLMYSIFRLSHKLQLQDKLHASMLVLGFGLIICSQAVINMSVTMGLMPTKGITLPLVSYGGSSLVITLVMLALILRAGAELSAESNAAGRAD